LSRSRLSFSGAVSRVSGRNYSFILTCVLASLSVRIHTAHHDERVHEDEDGEETCENGLHNDEDDSGDGFRGLGDTELFDKDQDAEHGKHSNDLDDNVDPVSGLPSIGSSPEQQNKHNRLDDELAACLHKPMSISCGNNDTLGKHVDDGWNEHPPVALLEVVVEETVFDPGLLVFVESTCVSFGFLVFPSQAPDPEREEGQDSSEQTEGNACKDFRSPRVTLDELVDAVQSPDAVKEEDQVCDGLSHGPPVPLAETSKSLREFAEQSPRFEDDLEQKDANNDGRDDDCEDEQDCHEGASSRNRVLLNVSLNTLDEVHRFGIGCRATATGCVTRRHRDLADKQLNSLQRPFGNSAVLGGFHNRRVLQVFVGRVRQVSAGGLPEIVDCVLQATPRNQ